MAKEWTDEEVSQAISEAVQIVREDRIDTLIRNRLSAPSANPNNPEGNTPPKSGGTNDGDGGNPTKRKSLWWGEIDDK